MFVYTVSLEYDITRASLQTKTIRGKTDVHTEKGGLRITRHPARLEIDNKAFFESLNIKSAEKILKDSADLGKRAVMKATARYAAEGSAMLGPDSKTIAEITAARAYQTINRVLEFIPKNRPEIHFKDGFVDISYEKDRQNVRFTPPFVEFENVPYQVRFHAVRHLRGAINVED